MRPIAILGLGMVVAVSGPAHADACKSNATQLDLDQCADADFRRADAALNTTYKTIMDRLRGDAYTKTLLVTAQKAWLAFRDADCAFDASGSIGGSMHPMVVSGCLMRMTSARTRALQGYLTCQEGDTGCPVPSR